MISIIIAAALIRRPLGDMTARIHPSWSIVPAMAGARVSGEFDAGDPA
jgi:hypothetical protein